MALPKVAFDELVHQHDEAYFNIKKKLEETLEQFKHVATDTIGFTVDAPTQAYTDFLKQMLDDKSIMLLDYPFINHEGMIKRYFDYNKPLGKHSDKREKDDAGYKDTLIWENVLDLLRTGVAQVVFVSQNISDFMDEETKELHSDLVNELTQHSFEIESVKYAASLKEGSKLVRDLCSLTTPEFIESIAEQITNNVDFDNLLTHMKNDIEDSIGYEIMLGDRADEPTLLWDIERSETQIETTEILEESGEVVVYANAKFDNEIEYYMFLDDYFCIEDTLNDIGFSLYGTIDSSNRALVGGDLSLLVELNFIYHPTTLATTDFEVVDVQRVGI